MESLPCVYEMEEMLYELGPYAAGLNAARWDLKASIFEFVMTDPTQVWPDRFGVDIKTTPFLANIFRRLVAISLRRGAVPVGGMATALPNPDPEVNRVAAEAIRADKQWEAEQGFIRGWVAHIFHMKTAGDPFKKLIGSGWRPTEQMTNPDNYPVTIKVPEGPVTVEGTRRNARMVIEYVEGWLGGRGAKGIDSLEGKPGVHPALMEDLATGRMSVAQIAQRIIHRARETRTGVEHDAALVKQLLGEELADILARRQGAETHERYRKALKIAMRWIKNYTELNFRSLGAYTRAELDAIAAAPDALLSTWGAPGAPQAPPTLGDASASAGAPLDNPLWSSGLRAPPKPPLMLGDASASAGAPLDNPLWSSGLRAPPPSPPTLGDAPA